MYNKTFLSYKYLLQQSLFRNRNICGRYSPIQVRSGNIYYCLFRMVGGHGLDVFSKELFWKMKSTFNDKLTNPDSNSNLKIFLTNSSFLILGAKKPLGKICRRIKLYFYVFWLYHPLAFSFTNWFSNTITTFESWKLMWRENHLWFSTLQLLSSQDTY